METLNYYHNSSICLKLVQNYWGKKKWIPLFFIIIPEGDPLLPGRAPFTRQGCLPPGAQLSQAWKSTPESWRHPSLLTCSKRLSSRHNSLVRAALALVFWVTFLFCFFLPMQISTPYSSISGDRFPGYIWLRKQPPPFSCAGLESGLCNYQNGSKKHFTKASPVAPSCWQRHRVSRTWSLMVNKLNKLVCNHKMLKISYPSGNRDE